LEWTVANEWFLFYRYGEISNRRLRYMRCPKCSYISFDYLDRCKSCGEDLVPMKIKLNIYSKPPEIDVSADGFMVGKVTEEKKEMLTGATAKPRDVSMDDVLKEEGAKLESFDFGEDKDKTS
jgi:hypothetical protein